MYRQAATAAGPREGGNMIEKAVGLKMAQQEQQEFSILKDNFNRKISYMRISITDRCNLRCTYCMPAWGFEWMDRNSLLTYDEILRLVSVAAKRGLYKVRVTGGEPLVRDGVVDFVAGLNAIPGITEITMTTNAVLLKNNVVLQKGVNDMEAVDFAKMTIEKPYDIRFIEYMRVNDYEDWKSKYIPVAEIKERISRELGELLPVTERESDGPA